MGPRAPAPKDGCIARRWSNDHRAAGARVAIEAQTRIALAARRENEGARRRPLPLEQPFFGEAEMPVTADDDMIDQAHIDEGKRLLERTRQRLVGTARVLAPPTLLSSAQ